MAVLIFILLKIMGQLKLVAISSGTLRMVEEIGTFKFVLIWKKMIRLENFKSDKL